jgi:phosphoribosylglycinamide formyltransferase-1
VAEDDTPDTLAARVFEAECEAYPEAIRLLAEGKVRVEGRRVIISS